MSESNIKVTSSASTRNSKRLLFDRRYGWVFDEWKDPAEEALAGGRQMFCIVPVSKAFFCMASQWIAVQCSTAAVKLRLLDLDLIYKMKLNRGQEMATFKPFLSHVDSYLSSTSCTEMIILGITTNVKPGMNSIRAIFCSSSTSICKYSSLRTLSEIVFLITMPPWVELKEFDVLC